MFKKVYRLFLVGALLVGNFTPLSASIFVDVSPNDWFAGYVEQLANAGIVSTNNSHFHPYNTLSRSELAKMAVGAANSQGKILTIANPSNASFCDIQRGEWPYPYVETLFAERVISGTPLDCAGPARIFRPNVPISRAEALKILLGSYRISAQGTATFNDVQSNMWYSGYIAKAVNLGLVNGYSDGTFRPNAFISRAEMSKILSKLMENQGQIASPTPTRTTTPSPTSTSNISPTPSPTVPGTTSTGLTYDIGSPTVRDIWVSPNGNDDNEGTQSNPLASFDAAWDMIPENRPLTTGYRIHLSAGTYDQDSLPNYLENRFGTAQAPIILQGEGNVRIDGNLNVFNTKYFYIIGITFNSGYDVMHFEKGDHILLRNVTLRSSGRSAQETLKVNQSQHIYIEDSDISGASDNSIDFVAVQYGHVVRTKIHDADDWCIYTKGGSAYLRIEDNEIYDCGTGGFTAGQGTGFEFMTAPWIHYEAYDIRVVNNIIHDTDGAGLGVNGGYNILMAHNTLYRVGERDHVIEVVFGLRGCDGDTASCQQRISQGGWGTTVREEFEIGNKHIMIYNNIVYNPNGYNAPEQIFAIYAPRSLPGHARNAPNPAVTDTDLQIKGNIIWSGDEDTRLGVGDEEGCRDSNSTCNEAQLERDNEINSLEPQLTNPNSDNFTLTSSSNVRTARAFALPSFSWNDAPSTPRAPAGSVTNIAYTKYRSGSSASSLHPGAY